MSATTLKGNGWSPLIDSVTKKFGVITSAVFGEVWRFCQMTNGCCSASQETIADILGISRKTVNLHLKRLVDAGYLTCEKSEDGFPNVYRDTGKAGLRVEVSLSSYNEDEEEIFEQAVTESYTGITEGNTPCNANSQGVLLGVTGGVTESYLNKTLLRDSLIHHINNDEKTLSENDSPFEVIEQEKTSSSSSIDKDEYKQRIARALVNGIARHSGKLDTRWLPEDVRPLGEAFLSCQPFLPTKRERSFWIQQLRNFAEHGITPKDITDAYGEMQRRGLDVKTPASLTGVIWRVHSNNINKKSTPHKLASEVL